MRERMRRAEEAVRVAEPGLLRMTWRWWAIPVAIVLLIIVAPIVWDWGTAPPPPPFIYSGLF